MTAFPFGAVLFDLDGVLVDTETMIGELWQRIFAEQQLHLSLPEITRLTSGQRFDGVLTALEQERGWKAPEDFLPGLEAHFHAAFTHVPALPGAARTGVVSRTPASTGVDAGGLRTRRRVEASMSDARCLDA